MKKGKKSGGKTKQSVIGKATPARRQALKRMAALAANKGGFKSQKNPLGPKGPKNKVFRLIDSGYTVYLKYTDHNSYAHSSYSDHISYYYISHSS
ncbi:MAG: hypothetical protein HYV14_16555 [Elusimicrobia bacterium]|nr:hypothetical protein [Elusimicrobiota bacterium]